MHYFPFHIGDYRSSTAHLTNEEDLAYRRLLEMYYDLEGPIPLDTEWVSRRIRVEASVVRDVLNDMFERTEEGYRNDRCDKEIIKYQALAERNRANGSRGGRPKQNPAGSESQPTGKLTKNQEPLTSNHIEEEAKASLSGTGFPSCPHGRVLELWKQRLPQLSQPRTWEGARQSALKGRWNQAAKKSAWSDGYSTQEEGLKWWDSFFTYIANDTKLASGFETSGRVWRPDLPWVLNATNFAKIIDGKYQK